MLVAPHPLDPNLIDFSLPERRIYMNDGRDDLYVLVDEEDYWWAQQWAWCLNVKKSRGNPLKIKEYARRAVGENFDGRRIKTYTLYLHIEIMKRVAPTPPTPKHVIVDHRDSDTFNCRRRNLRWATHRMNALNIFGAYPHDLVEG